MCGRIKKVNCMKNKILTFGFDDAEIHDRKLCEMFRKYGMKSTFFILSGQLGFKCDFHRYGEDTVVERVSADEIKDTYSGMEVASHTESHKCDPDDFEGTVGRSMRYLSELCGYEVRGLAYPGGHYTHELVHNLSQNGVLYSRTATVTHSFELPENLLIWNPTCKYDDEDINALTDEFLAYEGEEPILFYIYGHSYELTQKEDGKSFESFEKLLQKLSFRDDILYATNKEVAYLLEKRNNNDNS